MYQICCTKTVATKAKKKTVKYKRENMQKKKMRKNTGKCEKKCDKNVQKLACKGLRKNLPPPSPGKHGVSIFFDQKSISAPNFAQN